MFLVALLMLSLSLEAQGDKKTRRAADNSSENMSARKTSSQFNNGLRSFYTAQYDDAERIFSIITGNTPAHAPSYYMLSKIYSEKKLYSEAENALNKAIKYDKDNIWYKVALGETLLKTENFKKAVPLWEQICKELPGNEAYLYNLYECYQKLGNYTKMIEVMNFMEERFGPREEITRNKVAIWLGKNDTEAALREYDNLIDKRPGDVANYLKAGLLCEDKNLHDRALSYYEKAYSLFPDDAEANMMLANYWILRNNEEKSARYIAFLIPNPEVDIEKKMPFMRKQMESGENIQKLELWAGQLAKAHPGDARACEIQGKVSAMKGDFSKASEYFAKSLESDDSNIDLWTDFVSASEKSGNLGKLIGFEDEITTLFPQSPKMLSVLAKAFINNGNPDKAIDYYKNALAFAFDPEEVSAIKKGLHDAYMMKGDTESARKYLK